MPVTSKARQAAAGRTEYVMVLGTQSGSCRAASSCSLNTSMAFSHWLPSAEMRACSGQVAGLLVALRVRAWEII